MQTNSLNKLPCIFGLGMSGLAAARYFERIQQSFVLVDTRENPPGKESVAALAFCQQAFYKNIPEHAVINASRIILSPGVDPSHELLVKAREAEIEIIGDVELFVRETKSKIVAITGSNGKSTVTDLVYQCLISAKKKALIGGNFGVPVLDFLPQDEAEIYVLELSSFQLDTTRQLSAEVAVVLNITEDHMDRYNRFEDYCLSKQSIFNNAKHCVYNLDDAATVPNQLNSHRLCFSLGQASADIYVDFTQSPVVIRSRDQVYINVQELQLVGSHNWNNVAAVVCILQSLNIAIDDAILNTIKNYTGLSHRFQKVKFVDQTDWINDSKATNVGATQAALNAIDKNYYQWCVLIAGGLAKDADLSPLRESLRTTVDHLIVMGQDAPLLAAYMPKEKVTFVESMQQAVVKAKQLVALQPITNQPNVVLLSPACASMDMFKNFEARGQAFVDALEACA
ncbi:UDP-N-acetylmuramoyl-L-alanine--D-glutamate ligase [Aliikangiella sp. IMCC44632]